MNKLTNLFSKKSTDLLSIYLSAGYPNVDATLKIAQTLATLNVDFIELGMPFSDPLADGPVIQKTSEIALENGMNFDLYFKLAQQISTTTTLPIVFMGYYNQLLKIGVENFCQRCQKAGISALIVPDLPLNEYEEMYVDLFQKYNLTISFLVTPTTKKERIKKVIALSNAFLYVVSDNSITGSASNKNEQLATYLSQIKNYKKTVPAIVGFGIRDKKSYQQACEYLDGAIIGTAFLNTLAHDNPIENCTNFIQSIK